MNNVIKFPIKENNTGHDTIEQQIVDMADDLFFYGIVDGDAIIYTTTNVNDTHQHTAEVINISTRKKRTD